jgi:hypothetical protein
VCLDGAAEGILSAALGRSFRAPKRKRRCGGRLPMDEGLVKADARDGDGPADAKPAVGLAMGVAAALVGMGERCCCTWATEGAEMMRRTGDTGVSEATASTFTLVPLILLLTWRIGNDAIDRATGRAVAAPENPFAAAVLRGEVELAMAMSMLS